VTLYVEDISLNWTEAFTQ